MGREKKSERIRSVRDLIVYRKSFNAAMDIYEISKAFPREELYSLTDQIRRSSRSVCTSLSEGWRKRRYKTVFINKLSDAGEEAAETRTWLEFALACKYINEETYEGLFNQYDEIFAMVHAMTGKADAFCGLKQ